VNPDCLLFFIPRFSFQNRPMEQQLEIFINRTWVAPWADRALAFLADFGAWAPWLLLLLVLAVIFGKFRFRAVILAAGLAVGLSDGVGVNFLKHAVGRPRPSQVEPGVRMVTMGKPPHGLPKIAGIVSEPSIKFPNGLEKPSSPGQLTQRQAVTGRSFPSGHAANNMAVATVLILFFGWRGALYLPLALLICYSRVYTGNHWPLDVVAGMLLGVAGGFIATRLLQLLWRRFGSKILPRLAQADPELIP
jgi:undecaprenyl-diphosphatase